MPKPKRTSTPAQQRRAVEEAKRRGRRGTPVKPVAGGNRSVTARAPRGDSGRTTTPRPGSATKVRRSLRSVVEGGGPTYALRTQNGVTRYRLAEGRRSIRT